MPKEADEYTQSEIVRIYQTLGKYYTDIIRDMSKTLLNWLFVLNTGGLALTVTFMGTSPSNQESRHYLVGIIVIFAFGIVSTLAAAKLEYKRIYKKGILLDNSFDKFQDKKTTPKEFLDTIPTYTPNYDKIVPILEYVSGVFFFWDCYSR